MLCSSNLLWKISTEMKGISRRRFLQVAGITTLLAALPAVGGHGHGQGPKRVKVRPLVPNQDLSPTERAFFRKARFRTAADAMRAVASRRMKAEIYVE